MAKCKHETAVFRSGLERAADDMFGAPRNSWLKHTHERPLAVPQRFVLVELAADTPPGVEVWRHPDGTVAAGFSGMRGHPDWHFRFKTEKRLHEHIDAWLEQLRKAQRRDMMRFIRRVPGAE